MKIEQQLKDLILIRYGSMREFANKIGMSQSTFSTIMTRGLHNASISNVLKMCKELNISADGLAIDRIIPNDNTQDHPLILFEIPEMISYMKKNKEEYKALTIDYQSLSDIEMEILLNCLTMSVEFVRDNRKRNEEK
jgi:transcriptional regulator with XRE-family HTH domain